MCDLPWGHTAAYIPEKALSGAAIVALGRDEILDGARRRGWKTPDRSCWARMPLFRFAPEKIVSDLAVQMLNLAKAKGRTPALAEADGRLRPGRLPGSRGQDRQSELPFATRDRRRPRALEEAGHRAGHRGGPLSGGHRGRCGRDLGLAARRATASNWPGDSPSIRSKSCSPALTDTAIDMLELVVDHGPDVGARTVGLYIEFTMPGTAVGGLLAAVAFTLLFWSHFLGGTAGWLEVVLFLLGVAFMAVELFVVPGSVVAGLVGVVLMLVSLDHGDARLPRAGKPRPGTHPGGHVGDDLRPGLVFVAAAVFISRHFGTLPLFRRLTLAPPEPAAAPARRGGGGLGPGIRVGRRGDRPFAAAARRQGPLRPAPGGRVDRRRFHPPRQPRPRRADPRNQIVVVSGRAGGAAES